MYHGHVGGDVYAAVFSGGGKAENMVVLVDGAAHGAEAVVAVGHGVGHGKRREARGLGGLDDAYICNIVGYEAVEFEPQHPAVPAAVVPHDPIGHGLFPARGVRRRLDRPAARINYPAAVKLYHCSTPRINANYTVLWHTRQKNSSCLQNNLYNIAESSSFNHLKPDICKHFCNFH
jgi:hypothetical protein